MLHFLRQILKSLKIDHILLKNFQQEPITMLNALEDIAMVKINNDSAGINAMDLNGRIKTKDLENKEPVAGAAISSDKVNFSDASKQLETIKASFKDLPEVDAAKVAHFKAEIAAGNYAINSNAIAQKMMNNVELV
jgi:flagellar biosynthesis anti-sigma factor FlgM